MALCLPSGLVNNKGCKFEFCLSETWVLSELWNVGWEERWLCKSFPLLSPGTSCHSHTTKLPVLFGQMGMDVGQKGKPWKQRCNFRERIYACLFSIDHFPEPHTNFVSFFSPVSTCVIGSTETSKIVPVQRKSIK